MAMEKWIYSTHMINNNINTPNTFHTYIYYVGLMAVCVVTLIPWALTYFNVAINVDIAFLGLSAQRLLDGDMMSTSYYDTNPPLSILLYTPAAFLTNALSIPLYITTTICSAFYLVISTLCTYALLKKLPWTQDTTQQHLILITYIFANTISVNHDFGQRDHILGMALFPFILAQILITLRIPFSGWSKWIPLMLGSITILLKPHYGIIPVAIFLCRMVQQRRFWIIKDTDFLCLSLTTLGYLAIIFIFFNDFITVILPDIILFYLGSIDEAVLNPSMKIGALALGLIFAPLLITHKDNNFPTIMGAIALLSVIAFFLQGKGFIYQYIPAKIFISVGIATLIYNLTTNIKSPLIPKGVVTLTVLCAAFIIINNQSIHLDKRPTHEEYKKLALTKLLNECETKCSFFMFNDKINIIQELSVYSAQPHASRFPVLWFLPYLMNSKNNDAMTPNEKEQLEFYKNKHLSFILDDLKRYEPETLLIMDTNFSMKHPFDFITFTQEQKIDFIDIWANYGFEKTLTIKFDDYIGHPIPKNTINVDVYKKIIPSQ